MRLSVCMIVRDEARRLPLILGDISPMADEIIVVDTGSRDDSVSVATNHGARVLEFPWCDDFSAARNYSLDKATGDMILWLDADDRIDAVSVNELVRVKDSLEPCMYFLRVCNAGVNGSPFLQLRLSPNDKRIRFEGRVHESILNMQGYDQAIFPANAVITHTGYLNQQDNKTKLQRNMRLMRLEENKTYQQTFCMANTLVALGRGEEAIPAYEEVAGSTVCMENQADMYYASIVGLAMCCLMSEGEKWMAATWAYVATLERPHDIRGWYYLGKATDNLEAFEKGMKCRNYLSSEHVLYEWFHVNCMVEALKLKGVK